MLHYISNFIYIAERSLSNIIKFKYLFENNELSDSNLPSIYSQICYYLFFYEYEYKYNYIVEINSMKFKDHLIKEEYETDFIENNILDMLYPLLKLIILYQIKISLFENKNSFLKTLRNCSFAFIYTILYFRLYYIIEWQLFNNFLLMLPLTIILMSDFAIFILKMGRIFRSENYSLIYKEIFQIYIFVNLIGTLALIYFTLFVNCLTLQSKL